MQPDLDYADPLKVRAELARSFTISMAFRRDTSREARVSVQERYIPARLGSPPIQVRIYEKKDRERDGGHNAALVFFHGGGFVVGDLETEHLRCAEIADETGILVVSVAYRLAPENPFPLGLNDCYDATMWLMENSEIFGVDPARVAVGGSSAGGALAAAVTLMARDQGDRSPIFQLLLYPVMDDRMTSTSAREYTETPGWNAVNNAHMWHHYLAGQGGNQYAAPIRAASLVGLPPAYVLTAEYDPLRDEGLAYACRLLAAGVPTEIHQFPGTFHGFDAAAPDAGVSRLSLGEQCRVLLRGCDINAAA
jgi:acetyl esterase